MAFRFAQRNAARSLIRYNKINTEISSFNYLKSTKFCTDGNETSEPNPSLPGRFQVTAEVIVSKIFPAGFCWQGASLIAGSMALSPTGVGFALMTGVGDGLGVYFGHRALYLAKGAMGSEVDQAQEHQIGGWLATSAFLSGTAWQPVVNVLAGLGFSFTPAAVATTFVCGFCFFSGLRLGRNVFKVGKGDSSNLLKDAQLGFSIGGATGAFVGTDITFAGNWLAPVVGVEETTSDIAGMICAGSSTSIGFASLQSVQNLIVPAKSSWNDA